MKRTVWGLLAAFSMSSLVILAGQAVSQGQDTPSLNSATSPVRRAPEGSASFGWKWVDLSAALGPRSQINGFTGAQGVLQVVAGLAPTSNTIRHTLYKQIQLIALDG